MIFSYQSPEQWIKEKNYLDVKTIVNDKSIVKNVAKRNVKFHGDAHFFKK